MATNLDVTSRVRNTWTFRQTTDGISEPTDSSDFDHTLTFTEGTGDYQAEVIHAQRGTSTLATVVDLIDLSDLLDRLNTALAFTEIKGITIVNRGQPLGGDPETWTTEDGQDLLIGGAGSGGNAFAAIFDGNQDAKIRLRSGGQFVLTAPVDGYRVVENSQDILRIEYDGSVASGADIEYDLIVFGLK